MLLIEAEKGIGVLIDKDATNNQKKTEKGKGNKHQ